MPLRLEWQFLGPSNTWVNKTSLATISNLTLVHFLRVVQVSRADRMVDRGEDRERRLMASSQ